MLSRRRNERQTKDARSTTSAQRLGCVGRSVGNRPGREDSLRATTPRDETEDRTHRDSKIEILSSRTVASANN